MPSIIISQSEFTVDAGCTWSDGGYAPGIYRFLATNQYPSGSDGTILVTGSLAGVVLDTLSFEVGTDAINGGWLYAYLYDDQDNEIGSFNAEMQVGGAGSSGTVNVAFAGINSAVSKIRVITNEAYSRAAIGGPQDQVSYPMDVYMTYTTASTGCTDFWSNLIGVREIEPSGA